MKIPKKRQTQPGRTCVWRLVGWFEVRRLSIMSLRSTRFLSCALLFVSVPARGEDFSRGEDRNVWPAASEGVF